MLDPIWFSELWNCEHSFEKACPKQWSALARTGRPGIRHCHVCDKDVYLCKTPREFVENGNAGRCVAILDRYVPGKTRIATFDGTEEDCLKEERQREYILEWWREVLASETSFCSEAIEELRQMTKPRHLKLKNMAVTDAQLEHLNRLGRVEQLNLTNTQVTDAGLEHLHAMTNLRRLYLKGTQVTDEGVKKLKQVLPDCEIHR